MSRPHVSRVARLVAAVAIATLITSFSPGAAVAAPVVEPVVGGLSGPRGIDVGPGGRIFFSEDDGTISRSTVVGDKVTTVELGQVPAEGFAPALAHRAGLTVALTTGGPPGTGAGTLYRVVPFGESRPVADISAYQVTDPDPYDLEGFPEDSNPYGVELLGDGSALVADAAGNDLLRVYPHGEIVTVARIKPRVVPFPDGFPPGFGFPPAGTPIPSESVPTGVTVGADGYYYVGELRGFPATPGTSLIWRITPGAVDAVCDPDAPDVGDCQVYADGFTSIQDLDSGSDGSLYVLELVKGGWFAAEFGLVPPTGGLFRLPAGGGDPTELAVDRLPIPGGVAVRRNGEIFVTGPIFPGDGAVVARING
ncbi:hypothetical protein BH20ACT5_BH20ACT5_07680 [soil metagenome]